MAILFEKTRLTPIFEESDGKSSSSNQNGFKYSQGPTIPRQQTQGLRSKRRQSTNRRDFTLPPEVQNNWSHSQKRKSTIMRRFSSFTPLMMDGESLEYKETRGDGQNRHFYSQIKSWVRNLMAVIVRKSASHKLFFLNLLLFAVLVSKIWELYDMGPLTLQYFGRNCGTKEFGYNSAQKGVSAFPAPEDTAYHAPDIIDTFANYNYRNDSNCQISSLDLHSSFSPLCQTKQEFLHAFSGGGRIGFDRPFMPLDCDMRWFTSEEICQIFNRFEKIIVIGDSMMRHVVGALNVLLRKDLGYGAVTNWNFNDEELQNCFCNHQMDVKSCSVQGIFSTSSVLEHDPNSLSCTQPIDLVIEMMLRFPLDPVEVDRFQKLLNPQKPHKPYAFIFGHGLWNDLDLQATLNWLDGILSHTLDRASYLNNEKNDGGEANKFWPRLFITPNAAGIKKPDEWLVTQGDKALQIFEENVRMEVKLRGIDHLGTWNMSIQASKYDGVHLDLKGNLIKAMGVVNWLAFLDVNQW